jgi:hypothetical protein
VLCVLGLAGAERAALGGRAVRRAASGGPEVWPPWPPVAQRPSATARVPTGHLGFRGRVSRPRKCPCPRGYGFGCGSDSPRRPAAEELAQLQQRYVMTQLEAAANNASGVQVAKVSY